MIDEMIRSFGDKETEAIFRGAPSRRLGVDLRRTARRRLMTLHAAQRLTDLWVPPGNRLKRLKGPRAGQYSIRVNDQWRICFRWRRGDAHDVKIIDYH